MYIYTKALMATIVEDSPAKTPAISKPRCRFISCFDESVLPNRVRWNRGGYTRARGTAQTPPTIPMKLSNRLPATCRIRNDRIDRIADETVPYVIGL